MRVSKSNPFSCQRPASLDRDLSAIRQADDAITVARKTLAAIADNLSLDQATRDAITSAMDGLADERSDLSHTAVQIEAAQEEAEDDIAYRRKYQIPDVPRDA